MTWGELKAAMEKEGIKDEETIEFFDREMFNELVQLYRALDTPMAKTMREAVYDAAEWVDALRDRFTLHGNCEGSWADGIGFPYSFGDGRVVPVRTDREDVEVDVKVFFSSVTPFERPERYCDIEQ